MPLISVVTSVYNGEAFVKECVDSILNQTFKDFEYIILNNGSTDRTLEILSKYKDPRLRIIHQENLGVPRSLNKGVSLCSSDLIAGVDADDYVYPNWLEKCYEFMSENQEVVVCSCRFDVLVNDRFYPQNLSFLEYDPDIRKSMSFMNPIAHSFSITRRLPFLKVGGYDPKLVIAHDYDLWIRLLEGGKARNLNEILGVHRSHDNSYSSKKERTMIKEAFKVQWKAYRKLGGSFWKMVQSLSKRGIAWFIPSGLRYFFRSRVRR